MKILEALKLYANLGSVAQVARVMHVSPAKAVKLLITGGCYPTERARWIAVLRERGLTDAEIRQRLDVSRDALNKYTPYCRCVYEHKKR